MGLITALLDQMDAEERYEAFLETYDPDTATPKQRHRHDTLLRERDEATVMVERTNAFLRAVVEGRRAQE